MNPTQWAVALLNMLGIQVTDANRQAMVAWMNAEGGNWHNSAHFNPLNTTQKMPGSNSMNGVGVQSYTSWEQGLEATVKTIRNGNYGDIITALGSGTAQDIANAVTSSPWGTKSINVNGVTVSGNGTGSGSNSSTTAGGGKQAIDPLELAINYGFTKAFLDANPELKPIFAQAVKDTWSPARFQAALNNTQWWKTHSDSEKKWLVSLSDDPATAKQTMDQATTHIQQVLAGMGVGLTSAQTSMLAYNIVAKGWGDDQVKYFAGQYPKFINGKMFGDSETQFMNGMQYAYSMGVTMSNSWYQKQIANIERGTSTFSDLQQGIRDQAKAQYSQFSKQIDAGQTIQDLASPYIQQMSGILELNGSTLSAFDPTIKKALSYKDPSTGATGSQPLWQFENTLRQDPRWLQTNNARDSIMSTAHGVLQQFGLTF